MGAFVEGELFAIEDGDGGVHLHWVMGFGGRGVGVVDFDWR